MTRDEFWRLIDRSRRGAEDTDEQCEKLRSSLQELSIPDIVDFDHQFHQRVNDAFRWDLWGAAYMINGGCSDDGFDYFLGWLIAQGRKYYEAALADPEAAGKRVEPGEEVECEDIWYIAAAAYEAKTGKSDFDTLAKPVKRKLTGKKAWDEDTVDEHYPRLAKKFG